MTQSLVVDRVLWVRKVEDDTGVRLRTTILWEGTFKVDGAIEVEASIIVDVNIQRLEVSWSIDKAYASGLNEVICDNDMLLVGSDLDVMWPNRRLNLIRVVKTLDIVEVGDVEGSNVVGGCKCKIGELSVLSEVGTEVEMISKNALGQEWCLHLLDGNGVSSFRSEVVQKLSGALVPICIIFEWIDNPDLTEVNGSCERC